MELTSITLYGYSVINTIAVAAGWVVAICILIVILKIPFFLFECWREEQERKEGETDKQYSLRKWGNRVGILFLSGFIILVILHYI